MSDGIKGLVSDVGEAAVKPVVDEVGKALEQAAQSVVRGSGTGQNQNPPKPAEDQAKLVEARRKIAFWKNLADAQARVRAQEKAREEERLKAEEKKKEIKQFEVAKKQESLNTAVRAAQTRTEIKKGVGG